ncbi:MAG: LLM class flavin-dependent oxidoreductase [Thermomicrobiales bacterium]
MKIGLQLPEAERIVRWPELREMAITAERIGFDSLWVGDHLLYRSESGRARGPWEAWSTLAALAAVTERVILGPLVASTSFHAPAMMAKKASTIDEISNGRLILGLGAGWNEPEYRAFGFPYDRRFSRFEEAFTIIRRMIAGETVSFSGQYYTVEDAVLLPESAPNRKIPLLVGTYGEKMLRATLPWIDAWNAWYDDFGNDPEQFAALNTRVTSICEAVGRDPLAVERTAAVLVQVGGGEGRPTLYASGPQATPVSGSNEDIAARLREFVDAGAEHLQIVLDPITTEAIQTLARIVAELRPASS